ncbi:hypothetical protein AURDEDRAFT_188257 [Auricularia subglabra TFB-10046 SS5]|nr:hypothetical protein AURDEDRAFT_188257 [Auricularia subglabra TFB-10046 SS5]
MARKRAKRGTRSSDANQEQNVATLPNELLLEVWDHLPPMERVAVSQVCIKWRGISLSAPRLWSRVIFLFTKHWDGCRCTNCSSPRSRKSTTYRPRHSTTNAAFLTQLLLRSADLPLDVTLVLEAHSHGGRDAWFQFLDTYSKRIARIHSESGEGIEFSEWIRPGAASFPALRTVTAGFDDREIEYVDLPVRRYPNTPFPVLNQIHIGAALNYYTGVLGITPMPSVQELTLTPARVESVQRDLSMCPNLSRLNIVISRFSTGGTPYHIKTNFQRLAGAVANIRELCLLDLSAGHEANILNSFNSARHRHLILDYQGRPRVPGSSWYLSLPSPCDALEDAVRLTLRLREGVYEIDVTDALDRRREVLLDLSTIRMAPGLWDCYVSKKTVVAATVDALAWDYFATGLPEDCEIPELTIVVSRAPEELKNVLLARFASLRTLRIVSLRAGLRFDSAVLRNLVESRVGKDERLPVFSICANAHVENARLLSQVASQVEYPGLVELRVQ